MIDLETADHDAERDTFLVEEGLDLLSAFKAIRSIETRHAILVMIAAVAQAELDARGQGGVTATALPRRRQTL